MNVLSAYILQLSRFGTEKRTYQAAGSNNYDFTWAQIVDELNSLGYVDITTDVKNIRVRTNVIGCAGKIFAATGVAILINSHLTKTNHSKRFVVPTTFSRL
jgi:hypothetical protein